MSNPIRIRLTFAALLTILGLTTMGCEGPQGNEPGDVRFESGTIEGIFYYYETDTRVRVIDMDMLMRRSYTLSSDPDFPVTMQLIADERAEDVVLRAYNAGAGSPSHPSGVFIKPKMQEKGFLFTSNVIQNLMGKSQSWDWWHVRQDEARFAGFILHHMGKEDGEDTYAIESLHFPGHYISHQGHPIQGTNLLTYYPFPDKESAPRWRLFRPQGTYFEGNPSLVSL